MGLRGTTHPTHGLPYTGAHNIPSPSQRGATHPTHGLERNHTPNSWASVHKGTQHSICVPERNHTPNSWASPPHTGAHRSISVSERNHTPISWAHPTHGLSLRSTHSVCVLGDVSHSCNHQHSLSAREAFSTRPSLSRKYSNFVLASGLVKMSAIYSWVGRYCTCTVFLCTMSLI
jgi:hypothetical protein